MNARLYLVDRHEGGQVDPLPPSRPDAQTVALEACSVLDQAAAAIRVLS